LIDDGNFVPEFAACGRDLATEYAGSDYDHARSSVQPTAQTLSVIDRAEVEKVRMIKCAGESSGMRAGSHDQPTVGNGLAAIEGQAPRPDVEACCGKSEHPACAEVADANAAALRVPGAA
jgi:hypothetical protein